MTQGIGGTLRGGGRGKLGSSRPANRPVAMLQPPPSGRICKPQRTGSREQPGEQVRQAGEGADSQHLRWEAEGMHAMTAMTEQIAPPLARRQLSMSEIRRLQPIARGEEGRGRGQVRRSPLWRLAWPAGATVPTITAVEAACVLFWKTPHRIQQKICQMATRPLRLLLWMA